MRMAFICVCAIIFLSACSSGPPCEFEVGEMVRSKVSGDLGQVVKTHGSNSNCYVDVRFNASQTFTNSKVLSNDGPVTVLPLAIIRWMRPFELESAEEKS